MFFVWHCHIGNEVSEITDHDKMVSKICNQYVQRKIVLTVLLLLA